MPVERDLRLQLAAERASVRDQPVFVASEAEDLAGEAVTGGGCDRRADAEPVVRMGEYHDLW